METKILYQSNRRIIFRLQTTPTPSPMVKFLLFPPLVDRAGSISTLDSLDFARYSDDGNRETDERVAGE